MDEYHITNWYEWILHYQMIWMNITLPNDMDEYHITNWYEWIVLCNDLVECWIPCQLLRCRVSCNNVAPVLMFIYNAAVNTPTCNNTAHVHTYDIVPVSMSICNNVVLLSHSPHMMIQCLCNVTVPIFMFRHNDLVLCQSPHALMIQFLFWCPHTKIEFLHLCPHIIKQSLCQSKFSWNDRIFASKPVSITTCQNTIPASMSIADNSVPVPLCSHLIIWHLLMPLVYIWPLHYLVWFWMWLKLVLMCFMLIKAQQI